MPSPLLRRGVSHHWQWSVCVTSTWQEHERCRSAQPNFPTHSKEHRNAYHLNNDFPCLKTRPHSNWWVVIVSRDCETFVCKPDRRTTTNAHGAKKLHGLKYVDLDSAYCWGQIAHRWGQNALKNNNFGFPAPKTTVEPPLQSYRAPLFEWKFKFGAAATAIEKELVEGVCNTKSLSFSEIASERLPYISMGAEIAVWRVNRPSAELVVDSFQLYFG